MKRRGYEEAWIEARRRRREEGDRNRGRQDRGGERLS